VVSRIHADGEVCSAEHHETGTMMRVRVPAALAGELEEFGRHSG
jgi:GTPase